MNCYPENTQISTEVEATDASGATHETTCQMKFTLYDIDGKELFSESREVTKKTPSSLLLSTTRLQTAQRKIFVVLIFASTIQKMNH